MKPRRSASARALGAVLALAWRAAVALGAVLLCLRALGLSPAA